MTSCRHIFVSTLVGLCCVLASGSSYATLKDQDDRIARRLRSVTDRVFSTAAAPENLDTIGNGRAGHHTRLLFSELAVISDQDFDLTPSRYPHTTEALEDILSDPRGRALIEDFWRSSPTGTSARRAFFTLRLVGEQPTLGLVMDNYLRRGMPNSEVLFQIVTIWRENGREEHLRTLSQRLANDFLRAIGSGTDPSPYLDYIAEIGGRPAQESLLHLLVTMPPEGNGPLIQQIGERLQHHSIPIDLYKTARRVLTAQENVAPEVEQVMTDLAALNLYDATLEVLLRAYENSISRASRIQIIERMATLPKEEWPDVEKFFMTEFPRRVAERDGEEVALLGMLHRVQPQKEETWVYLRNLATGPAGPEMWLGVRSHAVEVLLAHLPVEGNFEAIQTLIRGGSIAITAPLIDQIVAKAHMELRKRPRREGRLLAFELWVEMLSSPALLGLPRALERGRVLFKSAQVGEDLEKARSQFLRGELRDVMLINGRMLPLLAFDFDLDRHLDSDAFRVFAKSDPKAAELEARKVGAVLSEADRLLERLALKEMTAEQIKIYFGAKETRSVKEAIDIAFKK